MHIKANTVIPADFKITKVAPSASKAKSVYTLLYAEEKRLEKQAATQAKANKFAAALKAGFSAAEALKLIEK